MLVKQILRTTLQKYKCNKLSLNSYSVQKSQNYRSVSTLTYLQMRNFHRNNNSNYTNFLRTENQFAYRIINKDPVAETPFLPNNREIKSETDFSTFLNRNWRASNATEIVEAFRSVKQYCIDNNTNLSDPRFDALVDGLVDHCDKLTDQDILELLTCLSHYPICPAYTSHNFHDLWSCLDDLCCWRMREWDLEKLFMFANAWYNLNMGKLCDFIFEVLGRLVKKADTLTKDQLVHIFFYYNVCRRKPVDFEYEAALEHKIKEINIDEMAVVALGYFKTQSKIKILSVQQAMIEEVTRKSMGIHEITLSAIMKTLRLSNPIKLIPEMNKMLDNLYPELDRLSDLCCLHVALIFTGLQTYHKNTLSKCSEKLLQVFPTTRIKDIERILNVLTMFNFVPKAYPDIFQAAYEELHKDSRLAEINQHPRCLSSSLNYLSLRGIYSYELMNRILNVEFIELTYGKQAKLLPRELLSLDACIDIECPGYKGNRLPPNLKYKAAKWLMEFTPQYNQWKKITAMDKLFLDTIDTVEKIVGNKELIFVHHVLPHFPRADIIICQDTKTGKFVKPIGFERYILGDVMIPFNKDDSLRWYAIVVLGWNNTIRGTSLLMGHSLMKRRQLEKIGYHPVEVIWNQFMNLSPGEKLDYVKQKLST